MEGTLFYCSIGSIVLLFYCSMEGTLFYCSIVLLVTGSIVLLVVYDIVYIVVSLERKDDGCTLLVIRLKLVFLRSLLNWMAATNSHSSSNLLEFFDLLNLNASFLLGYLSCIHPKNYGYVPHCTFC